MRCCLFFDKKVEISFLITVYVKRVLTLSQNNYFRMRQNHGYTRTLLSGNGLTFVLQ